MKKNYVQELPTGGFRLCTPEEVVNAKKLKLRLKKLEKKAVKLANEVKCIHANCSHPVCWDESGPMYDTRYCLICGHSSIL